MPSGTAHLPHQFVRAGNKSFSPRDFGMLSKISPGNYFTNLGSSARLMCGDGSQDLFTNLLRRNFLEKMPNPDQLATTNPLSQNLMLLSDQSSQSTPVATKSRVERSPAGLSVAALSINLSSLGPLYSGAVSNFKEQSSSARVSRAASPALGNSAENNRLQIGIKISHIHTQFLSIFPRSIVF